MLYGGLWKVTRQYSGVRRVSLISCFAAWVDGVLSGEADAVDASPARDGSVAAMLATMIAALNSCSLMGKPPVEKHVVPANNVLQSEADNGHAGKVRLNKPSSATPADK